MSRKLRALVTASAAGLLFLTGLTLSGCQELVEPLPGPPDFVGTVDHYSESDPVGPYDTHTHLSLSEITIDGVPEECGPEGTYCPPLKTVSCNDSTVVFVSVDGSIEEASLKDIAVDDRVEVWTTGEEQRSDPPGYTAVQIIILRD